jgi:hypothetical protein
VIRTILAVVLGYVVMAVLVLLGIVAAWSFIGPQGAFEGETVTASTLWSTTGLVCGFIAAIVGGLVAAKVGNHPTHLPVKALAGLVLVLGLLLAVAQLWKEPEPLPAGKTVETLTFFEAGAVAMSPAWYNFTVPWVGAAGVWIGGVLLIRKRD